MHACMRVYIYMHIYASATLLTISFVSDETARVVRPGGRMCLLTLAPQLLLQCAAASGACGNKIAAAGYADGEEDGCGGGGRERWGGGYWAVRGDGEGSERCGVQLGSLTGAEILLLKRTEQAWETLG